MITYEEFKSALKIVNGYKSQLETHFNEIKIKVNNVSKLISVNKEMLIIKTGCTVRLFNSLTANADKLGIKSVHKMKIKDFENISISKYLECRNVGKTLTNELKEICFYAGVSLKP